MPQFGTALKPAARPGATGPATAAANPIGVSGDASTKGITFRGAQAPAVSASTIMQHWGTSNPDADLNTDGIVDGQDLAMALNGPSDTQNTVLQNWGSGSDNASNNGDYNGDGTVDAMDLAMALNGGNTPRSLSNPEATVETKPEQAISQIVEAAFATRDADADDVLEKSEFSDSRRLFKQLDLDRSGSIGRDELTKALTKELESVRARFPDVKPQAFARRWMDALTTGQNAPNMAQFERVQQLFSKSSSPKASNQILSVRA
jgi:Ca2+-binding EF-hand superfamily protein